MTARVTCDFTWCANGTEVSFARGEVITSHDPRVTPDFLAWAERHDLVEVIGRSVRQAPRVKGGPHAP
jgi:hypothetical protein